MYERFTDGARKTMQLANQEAQRSNNEHVDCWHILAALLLQGVGIAARVLASFGVELKSVRRIAEEAGFLGADMVTMGKLPATPRAKEVMQYAMKEAEALRHNCVSTGHILLGLLRVPVSSATTILVQLKVCSEEIREEVLDRLRNGESDATASKADEPQSPRQLYRLLNETTLLEAIARLGESRATRMERALQCTRDLMNATKFLPELRQLTESATATEAAQVTIAVLRTLPDLKHRVAAARSQSQAPKPPDPSQHER